MNTGSAPPPPTGHDPAPPAAPESRAPNTRNTHLRTPEGLSARPGTPEGRSTGPGRRAGFDQLPGPTARREHPALRRATTRLAPSLPLRLPPVHSRIPAALLVPRAMSKSNTPLLRPAPCPHPPTICLAGRGDSQGLDGSPETAADERTGAAPRTGAATTPRPIGTIDDRQAASVPWKHLARETARALHPEARTTRSSDGRTGRPGP